MLKSTTRLLTIRTAEGVVFSQTVAGPLSRLLAMAIDYFVIYISLFAVSMILQLFMVISRDLVLALIILVQFIVPPLYYMLSEYFWSGQTIGKRLLRLRVIDARGLRLHFSQVGIRNLLRVVDSMPFFYAVGGISCFLSSKGQRLGDLAANTVVVRIPRLVQPDLEKIGRTKYNSLRQYPHLEARLRKLVSPQQASLALQALIRREEFESNARVELFAELADYFRRLVVFPPEVTEGVPDEQYVRNVVEILYSKKSEIGEAQPATPSLSNPTPAP